MGSPIVPHPHFPGVYADMNREYCVSDLYELSECQYLPAEMFSYPSEEDAMGNEGWFGVSSFQELSTMQNYLRKICNGCVVKEDCFAYALRHEEHLFWGGTTHRERTKLRKEYGVSLVRLFDSDEMDAQIERTRADRETIFESEDYYDETR